MDKITVTKFKKALGMLPKGSGAKAVDAAYGEALERIDRQLEGFRNLARRVLTLITYAYRPLSVLALREALAVEPGDSVLYDEALPEEEDIVEYCSGLVLIDHESKVVRLVHYTLQEIFRSHEGN